MINYKNIYKALKEIQETCENYSDCTNCPFATCGGCFLTADDAPIQWDMDELFYKIERK